MGNIVETLTEAQLVEKWATILDDPRYPKIDSYNRKVTMAALFENYNNPQALREQTVTGDVARYEPILVPVIRRGLANLIGMDIFGTQVMTSPSQLIFCKRSVYQNSTAVPIKRGTTGAITSQCLTLDDTSAFTVGENISTASGKCGLVVYIETANNNILIKNLSGAVFAANDAVDDTGTYSAKAATVQAAYENEAGYQYLLPNYNGFDTVALSEAATTNMKEMGMTIDKTTVTANSYRMKMKYTDELQQDLQAIHGIDADTELSKDMSNEFNLELNRTFIDYLNTKAAVGGTTAFDFASIYSGGDADGRWFAEKAFSFYNYLNKVANNIAKTTMRGRGNFIVASLDIVSILECLKFWKMQGMADGMASVDLGQTAFAGVLGGKYKVYADHYAASDYATIGYKGVSEWDAGIYYCPYVPLYIKKGMGEEDGATRLFFMTRYGMADNPFGAELYYRLINVTL